MKKELRNAGFVSLTLGALGCGEPAQPDAVRAQELFSKDTVTTDSLAGEGWRKYLDAKELHRAWAPPASSLWRPYYKPTLIAAVSVVQSAAMPVKNDSILRHESEANRFGKSVTLKGAAVFVDLPGEQSVAWGAALRPAGVQPIVTFNNWPHQFGLLRLERPLGALIYYADAMAQSAAVDTRIPAFLLERSRLGQKGSDPSSSDFDNRFFHPSTDFPSAAVLKNADINHIIYINPRGTAPGSEEDDLNEYFSDLARQGFQFTYVKAAEQYELAIVVPTSRTTIFTKESIAEYSRTPSYTPIHPYYHYHRWHTNYWSRSSGAWGGTGVTSGSSRPSSGFSS